MKNLLLVITLIATGNVFASPAVGDYVNYNIRFEQNGAYMEGKYEIALTAVDANENFQMVTTVTMEGQDPASQTDTVPKNAMMSEAAIAHALANCQMYGGTNGVYQGPNFSVPTCVMPQTAEDGTPAGEVQVAQVPFGLVKQVQLDASIGRSATLTLQSYTVGK